VPQSSAVEASKAFRSADPPSFPAERECQTVPATSPRPIAFSRSAASPTAVQHIFGTPRAGMVGIERQLFGRHLTAHLIHGNIIACPMKD
jgi:hypothetical protein